ncbi:MULTISPECIES: NAD(P)H-quinone oxidoreductase [unclassified Leeuwenhoekiella]|uniref:NAD(P)H-quinone oxidoreductase n=1 Tax=unclassified Leeuwenhoekiella TaxID=2615029 RepID=UPI000C469BD7|nr:MULTISPECIES: NAD(P)H-quinone oxidoreductase [unclassified Leeuwenhoekiella]MAW95606.1 zinc-binding dehydrogenase [Leeuwenhoekiella sp.]MBA82302.1 zinc-binding dehydrogenase [Leeuwenhoekiella sp.]
MKAIHITKAGGPEVLELKEADSEPLKPGQVRIAIKAAGVNRSDLLTRKNPDAYGADAAKAVIPGLEVSGEIIEVASDVTQFQLNDKVCALVAGGGYATEIAVDARLCLPIPNELTFIEAASLPEVLFTVWFNVFMQADAKRGEGLLIHGGTSGIGIMGLQMAKALGLMTYTTVGSEEKVHFIKEHNLAQVINYKKKDFEEVFKEEKIDVILDMIGGDYTLKNMNLLAPKGRLAHINGMNGLKPQIDLWMLMSKQLTLIGSLLKPQSVEVKHQIAKDLQQHIWPLLESGSIRVFIDKTFALADAAEAHRLMESSEHIGKIVLEV